ncbi:hypothetical protein A3Q56_02334 [Intoshia linei]|uniref:CTF/NF-I domain-containing protein n=1 Tax=Intoshia linei TaxID=1819745 RepID=A0A177B8H4_9BILA|nr:hypothetical protein A3Q56_02334 [Intoshia linei]
MTSEMTNNYHPFIDALLPHVMQFSYIWFNLQAVRRKHIKQFDKKLPQEEEIKLISKLELIEYSIKIKWAKQILAKLRKDILEDHRKYLIGCITNKNYPNICILTNPDQKGKMRRIDCLRQADKVWRLDLVMAILFKSLPLESTDGERLMRLPECNKNLCINPNHMSLVIREIDLLASALMNDTSEDKNEKMTYITGPFTAKQLLDYSKCKFIEFKFLKVIKQLVSINSKTHQNIHIKRLRQFDDMRIKKTKSNICENYRSNIRAGIVYCPTTGPLHFEKSKYKQEYINEPTRPSTSLEPTQSNLYDKFTIKDRVSDCSEEIEPTFGRTRYYSEMSSNSTNYKKFMNYKSESPLSISTPFNITKYHSYSTNYNTGQCNNPIYSKKRSDSISEKQYTKHEPQEYMRNVYSPSTKSMCNPQYLPSNYVESMANFRQDQRPYSVANPQMNHIDSDHNLSIDFDKIPPSQTSDGSNFLNSSDIDKSNFYDMMELKVQQNKLSNPILKKNSFVPIQNVSHNNLYHQSKSRPYIVPEKNENDNSESNKESSENSSTEVVEKEVNDEDNNAANLTAVTAMLNERIHSNVDTLKPLIPSSTFIGIPIFSPSGSPCGFFSPITSSLFPSPIVTPRGTPIPKILGNSRDSDEYNAEYSLLQKFIDSGATIADNRQSHTNNYTSQDDFKPDISDKSISKPRDNPNKTNK